MKRATITGLCCFGFLAVAAAATLDAVTIKRSPTKDQTYSYGMTGTIDLQGASHTITANTKDTIQSVDADGKYTTKTEQTDLMFDGNAVGASSSTVAVNKPSGELVSITSDSTMGDPGRLNALTQFYYPEKPVSVGDTWTYEGVKNEKLGVLGFKANMKLLGDEKVGTTDSWKIQEDSKETVGAAPCEMHTTVWVDKADGSMVKADSTFSNLPVGSDGVSGKMTITRK